MDNVIRPQVSNNSSATLPQTPHELPYNRAKIDELLTRVKNGESINLLTELLNAIDWRHGFADDEGNPLTLEEISRLRAYYREKFADVGPIFIAELLSTEFITEQRAHGDIQFSERLLELGRNDPELWQEISRFFRRKEMATSLLVRADALRKSGE
jgi:hypothetical protein